MKLKEFNNFDHRIKPPAIRFYEKLGRITFSKSASDLLGIKKGDRIRFFQSEVKEWFFKIDNKGYKLNQHTYEYTFSFTNKDLVNNLIKSIGRGPGNKFYFSREEIDGETLYKLTL